MDRRASPDASEHGHRLRALGTLSAGLAHEMNNLLTPILGYARLALQQPDDAELRQKALVRTHEAAERAVRACAAVMGLARGPEPTTVPHAVRVADAIDQAAAVMGWGGEDSDTQLQVDVEPADLTAAVAPAALEQVLINVMQNARRAMGPGGAVALTARADRALEVLSLTVRDDGPGVPQDRVAQLFEPFVTHPAAAGREPAAPGTGLGLWISRALLEAAGGAIDLDPPTPDLPGACFRLTLAMPRRAERADRQAA